jgi:hypothetical protein
MSAETVLFSTLSAAAAVSAIVATRIYPDVAPQDVALPCVAFSRTGTETIGTFSQAVVSSKATLECWCMSNSRATAETLGDAVQAAGAAAWFTPTSRRAEYDQDAQIWAVALTFDFWET